MVRCIENNILCQRFSLELPPPVFVDGNPSFFHNETAHPPMPYRESLADVRYQ